MGLGGHSAANTAFFLNSERQIRVFSSNCHEQKRRPPSPQCAPVPGRSDHRATGDGAVVIAFAVERDGEDGERAERGAPRSIIGAVFGCGGGPGLSSRRTVATRGAAARAQATRRQRARAVVSGRMSSVRSTVASGRAWSG